MPLKVRIKPEKKLFVGDVVIKNVGTRSIDLLILTDHPVKREVYEPKVQSTQTGEE